MIYLIHTVILGLAIFLIGRQQPDKHFYYVGVVLKLVAGVCLGLIFKHHYGGGDTFNYFQSAQTLANQPFVDWARQLGQPEIGSFGNQPRAILFTKIVSGFIVLTQGDYWIVSAYMSFVSFMAYWFFYRQIYTTLPNIKLPVVIAFLLLPSTLFWSAGIMKGTLSNAAIVYISAFSLKLFYRKKTYTPEILLTGLSIILLFYIKYYLLIIILPLVLYALFDRKAHRAGLTRSTRAVVYSIIAVLTIFIAPKVNPNLSLINLPENIYINQLTLNSTEGNPSVIGVLIEPTWGSLLAAVPKSILNGLFGPTVLASGSIWSWIPKLENLFLLLLAAFSMAILSKQKLWEPDILVIATLIFVLILATILPLAAPNFGSLSRYKAPMTPFFATLVIILPYWYLLNRKQIT